MKILLRPSDVPEFKELSPSERQFVGEYTWKLLVKNHKQEAFFPLVWMIITFGGMFGFIFGFTAFGFEVGHPISVIFSCILAAVTYIVYERHYTKVSAPFRVLAIQAIKEQKNIGGHTDTTSKSVVHNTKNTTFGQKKRIYITSILQLVIAGYCLYFGVGNLVDLNKAVSGRKNIADTGVVTDGTIVGNQQIGDPHPYLARYKFILEDYENPRLNSLKDEREQLKKKMADMPESFKAEYPELFEDDKLLSTFYGGDFRSVFGVDVYPDEMVKVMYDPKNPNRNIGGDRRGASYWDMTKGFRLAIAGITLLIAFGLLILRSFIMSIITILKRKKQIC